MTEQEARAAIKIEHHRSYISASSEQRSEEWEVFCPDGWQFSCGSHSLVEFSRKEADQEKRTHPIEPCSIDCDCHLTEKRVEP
jgi:hypothetical protein